MRRWRVRLGDVVCDFRSDEVGRRSDGSTAGCGEASHGGRPDCLAGGFRRGPSQDGGGRLVNGICERGRRRRGLRMGRRGSGAASLLLLCRGGCWELGGRYWHCCGRCVGRRREALI